MNRAIIYIVAGDIKGYSSAGRAAVSKTACPEFDSWCPCHHGHTKKMTHQKTREIPWFFAFYRAKKVPSEPWMTLGVFAGLTRFELSSYDFESKNKGYKGEFEENFSDSPFVIYVEKGSLSIVGERS